MKACSIAGDLFRGAIRAGLLALTLAAMTGTSVAEAQAGAGGASTSDPRATLRAGVFDAEIATLSMKLLANRPKPEIFFDTSNPGNNDLSHSDLAFRGRYAYVGNYSGFLVYDIADPADPRLVVSVYCPGGQGDISVHEDLLFFSAEQTRGRVDCGPEGVPEVVSEERFRGVRIFDLSDVARPRQVAAVQTCRGSHTHTLVSSPDDPDHIYVYVSGSGIPRPEEELPGCTGPDSESALNTSYSRIEVIEVPIMRPEDARIVAEPRVFADPSTGLLAGLWQGGDHGPGTQESRATMSCHDITALPEVGLAAGACSGNGILFDISVPEAPRRLHEVVDPNFAFWHSATFSNDGRKVVFTDEWGGGGQPRCRHTDPITWGANAIFDIVDGRMELAGYYKLPAAQGEMENCVAHNGSLIPVPGRDIMVQAWYQGGISVFDFTDSANPFEIAYFDRGPMDAEVLYRAGHWSAYWYNGYIYASEKQRGLDVLLLEPSEFLTRNEIEAANLIVFEEFNPQLQPRIVWPASVMVARALLDQLERGGGIPAARLASIGSEVDRLDGIGDAEQKRGGFAALATLVEADALDSSDPGRVRLLASAFRDLAR